MQSSSLASTLGGKLSSEAETDEGSAVRPLAITNCDYVNIKCIIVNILCIYT